MARGNDELRDICTEEAGAGRLNAAIAVLQDHDVELWHELSYDPVAEQWTFVLSAAKGTREFSRTYMAAREDFYIFVRRPLCLAAAQDFFTRLAAVIQQALTGRS